MDYTDPGHPHERNTKWPIPVVKDDVGRCLVCVLMCERDDARKERDASRRNHEREVRDLGAALATAEEDRLVLRENLRAVVNRLADVQAEIRRLHAEAYQCATQSESCAEPDSSRRAVRYHYATIGHSVIVLDVSVPTAPVVVARVEVSDG